MKGKRPANTLGLKHVALFVEDLDACLMFYVDLLGMHIEWQPDADNVYLSSAGADNLALHRWQNEQQQTASSNMQRLDHIGFILARIDEVDDWYQFFLANDVPMVKPPKTHRDGARSFYCKDPGGTLVQIMYHPPISEQH